MVFPANLWVQINLQLKLLHKLMGQFIMFGGAPWSYITVKVCLYPPISWEKPTFTEFRITSIRTLHVIFVHKQIRQVHDERARRLTLMSIKIVQHIALHFFFMIILQQVGTPCRALLHNNALEMISISYAQNFIITNKFYHTYLLQKEINPLVSYVLALESKSIYYIYNI